MHDASDYYARLSRDYPAMIRQLVPRYDEMIGCLLDVVRRECPAHVLDVGAGTGELTKAILEEDRDRHVTALERSPEMTRVARQGLRDVRDHIALLEQDALAFEPPREFDAVVSNLVLHNIPTPGKRVLLERMLGWLAPGGLLAWGDLIRHEDADTQRHAVDERVAFAHAAGCSEDLIRWNFRKEAEEDHPWTRRQTLLELDQIGYDHAECVWRRDTFAIVVARRPQA